MVKFILLAVHITTNSKNRNFWHIWTWFSCSFIIRFGIINMPGLANFTFNKSWYQLQPIKCVWFVQIVGFIDLVMGFIHFGNQMILNHDYEWTRLIMFNKWSAIQDNSPKDMWQTSLHDESYSKRLLIIWPSHPLTTI